MLRDTHRGWNLDRLIRAWKEAQNQKLNDWGDVEGPLTAARMSARRIGWNIRHPTQWTNDLGWKIDLLQTSPRMLVADGRVAQETAWP